jgi:hypothetical protein
MSRPRADACNTRIDESAAIAAASIAGRIAAHAAAQRKATRRVARSERDFRIVATGATPVWLLLGAWIGQRRSESSPS